jgi:hypothetical protein
MQKGPLRETPFVQAWQTAADNLGIDVIAPFTFDHDEHELSCLALVRSFGAQKEMLVVYGSAEEWSALRPALDAARDDGYGFSFVRDADAAYERDLFVATLNDWGWTGRSEDAPSWYTGEPLS